MSSDIDRQKRDRIVIETASTYGQRSGRPLGRKPVPKTREGLLATSVIAAAALATFLALMLTSLPYDPMNSTVAPQQVIPQGPSATPSPRQSPTPTPPAQENQVSTPQQPEPAGEAARPVSGNDAAIQAQIEKVLAADETLSKLDISTIVEGGKVTVVGSVGSADLKQRVEKGLRSVNGVVAVDNQLVVREARP